ncbi:MAG: ABC transporter ATP-binding protein [Spirochaetales bacterium]|nr:ABC transporter ATP-binding protein [Spirochaetales bacterium]
MNAIRTVNLGKRYGKKTAVKGLNLEIARGELFSLLGVNGAGKTTSIKMLCCLTVPSEGEAFIQGISINKELEVKKLISVSPQETAVAPNLTVRENLEFICGINGKGRKDAKKMSADTITTFGMEKIASDRAKTLSGGWQRRLSIAMALIAEPEILFLDEPTLGLDVIARRELWKVIESLKKKITIVLTTHYLGEAEALSDRIGIMREGDLVATGTVADLLKKSGADAFEDAFVALASEGGIEK